MKKLLNLLIIFLFLITTAPLFSQDGDDKSDNKVPKAFIMGEIVVKEKALATVEDASTTTVITDKDIKARGDKTLDEALRGVPGVQITQAGKGLIRMNLRGFDQDRLAFLIDGIPIPGDIYDGSAMDLSRINIMNVSKIVVSRGAVSALYGSNGALGAINVVTKKPIAMYTNVNAEYGMYNNYTLNVAHGSPIGDAYYWLTFNMQNSDGYEISSKLSKSERLKWFNKIVRYDLYTNTATSSPYTLTDMLNIKSVSNYLNDTGKWNHTEYTNYNLAGKIGYNITDKMEAGVSASYSTSERKSNTFKNAVLPGWDNATSTFNVPRPFNNSDTPFENRAFYWPEAYDLLVSPYFSGEFGDFFVRANIFYYRQMSDAENYGSQDHTIYNFPASADGANQPMFDGAAFHSIWTEESMGINIFPSYRIVDWNKINFAVMYRIDSHTAEEKPISTSNSPTSNEIWDNQVGWSKYKTKYLEADYLTLAVEDEFKFNELEFTVGVSYDAQKLTANKSRPNRPGSSAGKPPYTLSDFGDYYKLDSDSMIWGTRDSFNPVASVLWTAMKDFLKLRSAFSSKTVFPTLQAYSRIDNSALDTGIKPERSYNVNAGFEVTPLGDMLNIRADYFYSRFNDKLERVYVPGVSLPSSGTLSSNRDPYMNIDGVVSQGIELLVSSQHKKVAGIVDLSPALGYTYTHARQKSNFENPSVNKGDKMEDTPTHIITFDIRADFISGTSLNIFGQHIRNQVRYALNANPTGQPFSTDCFTAVELHNPFMLNAKLSQKLFENFEVYILCRNILDDYDADPFNPGPGRMFYFGGSATF